MFSFPVRKIPVVQPYVFALSWVTRGKTYQKFYRHQNECAGLPHEDEQLLVLPD